MKKLDNKAFWLTLCGILGTLIYRIINLALSKFREFPRLAERIDAERLEKLTTALFRLNFITTAIFALVCAYFLYRLLGNRKKAQGQKYITFLFVVNIIVAVFNALSVLLGSYDALISIAINVLIVVGCYIQKNYSDSIEA